LLYPCSLLFARTSAASTGSSAGSPTTPRLIASINGANLSNATEASPLSIRPGQDLTVSFKVRNSDRAPLDVRYVELQGRIAGLTFYSFDTEVNFDVPRGGVGSLAYVLDTATLRGQVTGLVPSGLALSGPDGNTLASEDFVAEMKGSLWSVYGLFGLGIVALTVLALVEVVRALARGRLPVNRWRRGTRFMAAGLGVGGVAVFSASALSIWLPSNGHWFVILSAGALAGFVAGYLTPTPDAEDGLPGDEDDDEEMASAPSEVSHLSELGA
jgi:hypothetical protein